MVIHEEEIKEALCNQLGLKIPSALLLYRHHQRGQEAYLVSWLRERDGPQDPTDLDKPNEVLRMYCKENGLYPPYPIIILWSSRISPGRIGIVDQVSTNEPGSRKRYFIRDQERAGVYSQIMEPYLTELKAKMGRV